MEKKQLVDRLIAPPSVAETWVGRHFRGLNVPDICWCRGLHKVPLLSPFGTEDAGIVEAVNDDVPHIAVAHRALESRQAAGATILTIA